MRALPPIVTTLALALWWAPTLALAAIRAAPHVVAGLTAPYRMRRVHRLIDRGRVDEAERVIAALRRDHDAAERWREAVRP